MRTPTAIKSNRQSYQFLQPNIHGVIARIRAGEDDGTYADAICLTKHDLVISSNANARILPQVGDVVDVCLLRSDEAGESMDSREAIVHWQHTVGTRHLIGMFLKEPAPGNLLDLTWDDRRNQLRFPTTLRVEVHEDGEAVIEGRISDYSLDGVAVHTEDHLDPGTEYVFLVPGSPGPLELHASCQWSIETSYGYISGCSLREGEGVMLAVREDEQPVMPWELSHNSAAGLSDERTPAETSLLAEHARHNARIDSQPVPDKTGPTSPLLPVLATAVPIVLLWVQASATLIVAAGLIAIVSATYGWLNSLRELRVRDRSKADARARLNERVSKTCLTR